MSDQLSEGFIRSVHFQIARAEERAAYENYNAASAVLTNARVNMRLAELGSQSFESVAKGQLFKTVGEITDREREIGIAFARYAATGRTDK